jgi:2-keto-4-pentenoate hydratase/2-oxohepta-3-ene-1,7-dioic acid hydratase in catechol pathway
MKLITFEIAGGSRRIGAVVGDNDRVVDLTAAAGSANAAVFADMLSLIDGGEPALAQANDFVKAAAATLPLSELSLLSPIPVPRRLRDFLSYERPIYYKSNCFSVVGSEADVHWPSYSVTVDYELEVALIVGRKGKNISVDDASQFVFGYCIFNDFSARDVQYTEMPGSLGPSKGKDFDTGNALGPWIATSDEVDPQNLTMIARVNGDEWSRGNSSTMHHSFAKLLAYASLEETVYPGEVLGSGTVGGGCGNELGRFMKHGDVIELEVSGLGVLRNRIVAPHVLTPPAFPIHLP